MILEVNGYEFSEERQLNGEKLVLVYHVRLRRPDHRDPPILNDVEAR